MMKLLTKIAIVIIMILLIDSHLNFSVPDSYVEIKS